MIACCGWKNSEFRSKQASTKESNIFNGTLLYSFIKVIETNDGFGGKQDIKL